MNWAPGEPDTLEIAAEQGRLRQLCSRRMRVRNYRETFKQMYHDGRICRSMYKKLCRQIRGQMRGVRLINQRLRERYTLSLVSRALWHAFNTKIADIIRSDERPIEDKLSPERMQAIWHRIQARTTGLCIHQHPTQPLWYASLRRKPDGSDALYLGKDGQLRGIAWTGFVLSLPDDNPGKTDRMADEPTSAYCRELVDCMRLCEQYGYKVEKIYGCITLTAAQASQHFKGTVDG